jgi:signal transduction histidine kinase
MVARKRLKDSAVRFADRPLRLAHPEPGAEKFEELLADLSGTFIRTAAENIDDQIELWLKRIVLSLGLDRGTLTQFDNNDSGLWVTHQWARKGISAPNRGREVSQYLPWLVEKIASGEMVVFSNLPYRLPRKAVGEREFIVVDGVKSHITLPLKIGGNVIGGLSFATVLNERRWTKQEIQRLRLVAAVFGNALERKRAFAEHRRLEQELRTKEGVALVGELGAVLMHELRQPLTAILANAEVAQNLLSHKNPRVAEIRDALADIIRDTARADDLVGKVRAIFQSSEAEKSHVEIKSLLLDVERIAGMTAKPKDIRLSIEKPDFLPTVLCNRTQLTGAILILVFNAFESVSVGEAPREVSLIAAQVKVDWVRVSVRDSGTSIDPKIKASGMGLGLPIVRSIIESHRGRIWASRNPDRGATFEFELPIGTKMQSAPTVSAASEADYLPGGAEKRLLDRTSLIIVQEVCTQFGLTPAEIFSKRRIARIALGRMIAIYLCRLITNSSFARIGDVFDRDHSTVMHAIRHIESIKMQRPMFQETIRSIRERITKRLGL